MISKPRIHGPKPVGSRPRGSDGDEPGAKNREILNRADIFFKSCTDSNRSVSGPDVSWIPENIRKGLTYKMTPIIWPLYVSLKSNVENIF